MERSKEEYLEEILKSMTWLGLEWDEFYKQSDRFELYRQYAQKLLDEGKAYTDGPAVILKMPQMQLKFFDLIRGEVEFDSETIKDQVLIKSDGSPTYSFACVVDDALMEISHVIRGEDHISNTPKQLAIYQALDLKPPKFAHVPLIMDEEGGRMSKRSGATAVSDYRKNGFLPEALVNYLMLLGWSPGDNQEIVSLQAAVKKFSIKKVNKSAAAFSMSKLKWLNAEYLKKMPAEGLADFVAPFLKDRGWISEDYDRNRILNIVELYQNRMSDIEEFLQRTAYLFQDDFEVPQDLRERLLSQRQTCCFPDLEKALEKADPFSKEQTEAAFRRCVEEKGLKMSEVVHPVRVALTGSDVGPGLFETMAVLGKHKTLQRIQMVSA